MYKRLVTIQAKAQAKAKNVGLFQSVIWKVIYRNANLAKILRIIRKDISTGSIGNALPQDALHIHSLEYLP